MPTSSRTAPYTLAVLALIAAVVAGCVLVEAAARVSPEDLPTLPVENAWFQAGREAVAATAADAALGAAGEERHPLRRRWHGGRDRDGGADLRRAAARRQRGGTRAGLRDPPAARALEDLQRGRAGARFGVDDDRDGVGGEDGHGGARGRRDGAPGRFPQRRGGARPDDPRGGGGARASHGSGLHGDRHACHAGRLLCARSLPLLGGRFLDAGRRPGCGLPRHRAPAGRVPRRWSRGGARGRARALPARRGRGSGGRGGAGAASRRA